MIGQYRTEFFDEEGSSVKNFGFQSLDEVLDVVENKENNIKFVRFMFTDIIGRAMDFTIPAYEFRGAFERGKGFDGSSIEGLVRIFESDLNIRPEWETFRVLPWEYVGVSGRRWREAVVFGDILNPDGTHNYGDVRYVLKKMVQKAVNAGFSQFRVGPELEFFIFDSDKDPKLLDEGGYFYGGKFGEVRKEVQLLMEKMGLRCEFDHHEVAPSQHEVDLKHLPALEMADSVVIFKYLLKKVARMAGVYATFMPKPLNGVNGSGMHVHQSLWRDGKNAFFDENDEYYLSSDAKHYIAGLMKHGPEITAILNQWVNSYKRLVPGFEAPVYIGWGSRNRSAFVRVPDYEPGQDNAIRAELRSPDPACNIYLAFSVMLAAGLEGIKKGYAFPGPIEENIYEMNEEARAQKGIISLPGTLKEAVAFMQNSKLLKETLGGHIFSYFIRNKLKEIKAYETTVTNYDVERYLPQL
jgi:glutamine synthetase